MPETRKNLRQYPSSSQGERGEYLEAPSYSASPGSGLLFASLTVLGLGAVAWYYLGPDVKRYLRIRNM